MGGWVVVTRVVLLSRIAKYTSNSMAWLGDVVCEGAFKISKISSTDDCAPDDLGSLKMEADSSSVVSSDFTVSVLVVY